MNNEEISLMQATEINQQLTACQELRNSASLGQQKNSQQLTRQVINLPSTTLSPTINNRITLTQTEGGAPLEEWNATHKLSLYRDRYAELSAINEAVNRLALCFPNQKDPHFWAMVRQSLEEQKPTQQQIADIVKKIKRTQFVNIADLYHRKDVDLYTRNEMLAWYNRNKTGNRNNLEYFCQYPINGEMFYVLWSDLDKQGIDTTLLKKKQAEKFAY